MKIEKLQEGMSFKNYKEFCIFLETKMKTGNAKIAQLTEIECYCRLGREGNQINVKEMYASVLEIKESRGSKSFYQEMMQALITDHLIVKNVPVSYISRNKILNEIDMLNDNYVYGEKNVKTIAEITRVAEAVIYDFFITSNRVFKNAFEVALKNLEQKSIVFSSKVKMFAYTSGSSEAIQYREATEIEIYDVLAVEKIILKKMGHLSVAELKFKPKTLKAFHKQVSHMYNTTYSQGGFNLCFNYNAYKVIVNEKFIEEDHELTLRNIKREIQMEAHKNELNQIVCERLFENAKERKRLAIQSNNANYINKARRTDDYVENNQTLIELLINRTANTLKKI